MVWEGPRSNPGPYPDFVRWLLLRICVFAFGLCDFEKTIWREDVKTSRSIPLDVDFHDITFFGNVPMAIMAWRRTSASSPFLLPIADENAVFGDKILSLVYAFNSDLDNTVCVLRVFPFFCPLVCAMDGAYERVRRRCVETFF